MSETSWPWISSRIYLVEKLLEVIFEVFPPRAIVRRKVLMHVNKCHSLSYHGSTHLIIFFVIHLLRTWSLSLSLSPLGRI